MASQGNSLVKVIVIAVIAFGAYKYGWPWLQAQGSFGLGSKSVAAGPDADCVVTADSAVSYWSGGVLQFMNPPIDQGSWGSFRSDVERSISEAQSSCSGCSSEACDTALDAVSQLSSLLSDMDSAARSGGAPRADLVRSQERLDSTIAEAWDLLRASEK